jgi:hypothetical protein
VQLLAEVLLSKVQDSQVHPLPLPELPLLLEPVTEAIEAADELEELSRLLLSKSQIMHREDFISKLWYEHWEHLQNVPASSSCCESLWVSGDSAVSSLLFPKSIDEVDFEGGAEGPLHRTLWIVWFPEGTVAPQISQR